MKTDWKPFTTTQERASFQCSAEGLWSYVTCNWLHFHSFLCKIKRFFKKIQQSTECNFAGISIEWFEAAILLAVLLCSFFSYSNDVLGSIWPGDITGRLKSCQNLCFDVCGQEWLLYNKKIIPSQLSNHHTAFSFTKVRSFLFGHLGLSQLEMRRYVQRQFHCVNANSVVLPATDCHWQEC